MPIWVGLIVVGTVHFNTPKKSKPEHVGMYETSNDSIWVRGNSGEIIGHSFQWNGPDQAMRILHACSQEIKLIAQTPSKDGNIKDWVLGL